MDCGAMLREAADALRHLSPHEELLLRLHFGIGGKRRSIGAIARHLGLREEDLRELESRALSRLRQDAIAREQQLARGGMAHRA